jgi:mono/diheme cytochrome c family protein
MGMPSTALIARGKEVYDLYECYNCHKVGGKGGVKRRGPELDHVKEHFTAKQLADRILYPFAPGVKATEGFEKEFDEQVMPDYYPEQISKEEMNALVVYLFSLKK